MKCAIAIDCVLDAVELSYCVTLINIYAKILIS